jgi:mono/diheme cytochrome c family protein
MLDTHSAHRGAKFCDGVVLMVGMLGIGVTGSGRGADSAKPTGSREALDPAAVQFFESKVRPILAENCYKCHGPERQKGGLRLDSSAALREGANSGPIIVVGKPKDSVLIRAVNHDGTKKMPPKTKLKPEEIAALTEWVEKGAPWPEVHSAHLDIEKAKQTYWAFQPVKDTPCRGVKDTAWPQSPIDYFILAKLEEKGLRPAPPADKRTLIRRATFDLLGLPPAPEAIDDFLNDQRPDAYERVIDRLLASPHYGERWGRHWLDLVRYADTAGDNSDFPVPQAYKYRNWVIQAFNRDKPYDQFLREQIAGDLMPAANDQDRYAKAIATGYLANARRFGGYKDDDAIYPRYPWHLTIEDTIDNLGRTVLGLTINCARCHDHKFDPITNEDYYALYGFFQSTRYPWPGIEDDKVPGDFVPLVGPEEVAKAQNERQEKISTLDAEKKRLEGDQAAADKTLQEAVKGDKDKGATLVAEAKKRLEQLDKAVGAAKTELDVLTKRPLPFEMAYAVAEGKKKVGNAHIQIKGNPERPGKEVPRHFPLVLGGQALSADVRGSGRLQLAQWLTDPANPLTARVMVNRIWQHHFGKGIVATPSDFGTRGTPPTHPELLDFLTARFTAGGWSVKAMHRLIMLSRTYQLASRDDEANAKVDINNDYLWRFNRHRLDVESIRDTLLAVSGALDRSMGGPHPFPDQTTWDFSEHKPFTAVYETQRRSVYLMTQRFQRHPLMALFDGPDTNASTATRITSTTPPQALFLMNSPFVHQQAKKLAERVLADRPDDAGRTERVYQLALGRSATAEEQSEAKDYLARVREKLRTAGVPAEQHAARAWQSLVRGMFLTSEFIYVE